MRHDDAHDARAVTRFHERMPPPKRLVYREMLVRIAKQERCANAAHVCAPDPRATREVALIPDP
ncbi:MAG: hypothetical protein GEU99_15010 [Luteitalea sp.]|nr:hypothetical protein [Luteitalea sp.]